MTKIAAAEEEYKNGFLVGQGDYLDGLRPRRDWPSYRTVAFKRGYHAGYSAHQPLDY